MSTLATTLALLIAAAGWHYLFYSRAAERLAGVEQQRLNRLRVVLRRAGGAVLLVLGPTFFAGFRALALSSGLLCPACKRAQPVSPADYGLVHMQVGNQPFTLELAATDKTRQHGLMHRQSLPADRGMLFVFPDEAPRSFWMRNTLIPLDIVYLDSGGKVVSISQMKALD